MAWIDIYSREEKKRTKRCRISENGNKKETLAENPHKRKTSSRHILNVEHFHWEWLHSVRTAEVKKKLTQTPTLLHFRHLFIYKYLLLLTHPFTETIQKIGLGVKVVENIYKIISLIRLVLFPPFHRENFSSSTASESYRVYMSMFWAEDVTSTMVQKYSVACVMWCQNCSAWHKKDLHFSTSISSTKIFLIFRMRCVHWIAKLYPLEFFTNNQMKL